MHLFCFRSFSKFWCWFLAFTKGGKSASLEAILTGKNFSSKFYSYQTYESINFQPAGFLAFKEKNFTPLLIYNPPNLLLTLSPVCYSSYNTPNPLKKIYSNCCSLFGSLFRSISREAIQVPCICIFYNFLLIKVTGLCPH